MELMQEYVINAIGPDRPGIVDQFSSTLADQGCNIADSRMVNLRGQFALVVLVEVPGDQVTGLKDALASIAEQLGLSIQHTVVSADKSQREPGVQWRVETYAMDQPGIVRQITRVLHQMGVNIEELDTRLEPGSYSGAPVFSMNLLATVPVSTSISELKQRLQDICDEMNCDITFKKG